MPGWGAGEVLTASQEPGTPRRHSDAALHSWRYAVATRNGTSIHPPLQETLNSFSPHISWVEFKKCWSTSMFLNQSRNLYSHSTSRQDTTIYFKVIYLSRCFKKSLTQNQLTVYPYDISILMGPFQLQVFQDSMTYVGDACKYQST